MKSTNLIAASAALAAGSVVLQPRRVHGATNIKRFIQQQKRQRTGSAGSIATDQHKNSREVERRLRQEARLAAKQAQP